MRVVFRHVVVVQMMLPMREHPRVEWSAQNHTVRNFSNQAVERSIFAECPMATVVADDEGAPHEEASSEKEKAEEEEQISSSSRPTRKTLQILT